MERSEELEQAWAQLGPFRTLDRLGLKYERRGKQAFIRCPWHADKDPSCTVGLGPSGTLRIHCFSCDQTWDIHSLVAEVEHLDVRNDFPELLNREADLIGRHDLVEEGKAQQVVSLAEQRPYPPIDEVLDLLAAEGAVRKLDAEKSGIPYLASRMCRQDRDVVRYLNARKLEPMQVDLRGLARAISPDSAMPAWARYQGQTWWETGHRLILPMYDAKGEVRSVRACRVIEGDTPKRLPPAGFGAKGLVMADPMGVELLRAGRWPQWASTASEPRVVICEGEPDFLSWATWVRVMARQAILGIVSGSWTDEFADVIPDGARVAIWTDVDEAGDRYAKDIKQRIGGRCECERMIKKRNVTKGRE